MTEEKKEPRRARQKKAAPPKKEEVVHSYADSGLEKSGRISLTAEELKSIRSGTIPERISKEWGLTLAEAREMVMFGCYEVIKK